MRVLMALTYYHPHWTGLTAITQKIAEGLAARGHTVTVLTSQHNRDLPREETYQGVRIVRLPTALRLSRGQVMPGFIGAARELVLDHDVVQVHTPMLEAWLLGVIAHAEKRKMLMTHHGDLVMPAGLWNQFVQRTVGFMLDRGAAVADHITTHSQDYAEHSAFLKPHLHKLTAIYPAVVIPEPDADAVGAWRADLGLGDRPMVGFAGRFVEEKGFDYLLQAIPLVARERPDVVFAYAGDHKVVYESFFERWRHLVDANAEHLRFLGLITDRQKLANFYAMCNVFALPSRTDCFAIVQTEALFCRTPVVCTDIPGAREVVQASGMGCLVEPHSPEALAAGLLDVINHPERYPVDPERARQIFSLDETISRYEALLGELATS